MPIGGSFPKKVTKFDIGLGNVDNTADNVKTVLSATYAEYVLNVPTGSEGTATGSASGDLTGSYPNPTIANSAITPTKADLTQTWNFSGALQSGSQAVILANDPKLTDSRSPNGLASGDLTGSYPNPSVKNNAISPSKADLTQVWNFVGTLQSGSQNVVVSNDSRLTDSRVPTGNAGGDLTGSYPSPTLASIVSASGPLGGSAIVPVITIDAKGRVTTLTTASIQITEAQVTALVGKYLQVASGTMIGTLTMTSGSNISFNGGVGAGQGAVILNANASPSYDTNLVLLGNTGQTGGFIFGNTAAVACSSGPFFAARGNSYSALAGQRGKMFIGAGTVATPAGTEGSIDFSTGETTLKATITRTGEMGIGVSVPTAILQIKAGTATAGTAPLKLTSGPLTTAAEAGAIEFLTDSFYGTKTTGAARAAFVQQGDTIAMGTNKITGLGDPALAQDAATKNYVDLHTTGALPTPSTAGRILYDTGTAWVARTRRTAIDSNTQIQWLLGEASTPWANTGAAGALNLTNSYGTVAASSRGIMADCVEFGGTSGLTSAMTSVGEIAQALTVSFWVWMWRSSIADSILVNKLYRSTLSAPYGAFSISIDSGNTAAYPYSYTANINIAGTRQFATNKVIGRGIIPFQWNLCSITFDGTTLRQYTNGELYAYIAVPGAPTNINWGDHGAYQVGADSIASVRSLEGRIEDVRVENVVRTQAYLRAMYLSGLALWQP